MTRIKEAREALGITAVEAARRIGISRQRYSQYERGIYEANYEMLLRIGEAFGVTVDWLLNREGAPAELRKSALVGRVMSLSDDQVRALSAALDELTQKREQVQAGMQAPLANAYVPVSQLEGQDLSQTQEVRNSPKSSKCG